MSIKLVSLAGIALGAALVTQPVFADRFAGAVHILVDGGGNTLSALVAGAIGASAATAKANTDNAGQVDVYAVGTGGTISTSGGYLASVTQDSSRGTLNSTQQAGTVINFDATAATYSFDPDSKYTSRLTTDAKTTTYP